MLYLGDRYYEFDGVSVFSDSDPESGRFYYLPNRVSLVEDNGQKVFRLIKFHLDEDKTKVKGGFLLFTIKLALDPEDQAAIKGQLRSIYARQRKIRDKIQLVQVPFETGKVQVVALNLQGGAGAKAEAAPGKFVGVQEIMGSSAPSTTGELRASFSLALDENGVQVIEGCLRSTEAEMSPVGVLYDFTYSGLQPNLNIKIDADLQSIEHRFKAEFAISADAESVILDAGIDAAMRWLIENDHIKVSIDDFVPDENRFKTIKWAMEFFKTEMLQRYFDRALPPTETKEAERLKPRTDPLNANKSTELETPEADGEDAEKEKDDKPKDDKPKDDKPKDDKPKDDKPKDDKPKEGEAKKDEAKKDEPKVDEPKKDEPKKDEPKEGEPKKDEPKEGEPKKDEPKVDEPKKDGGEPESESSMDEIVKAVIAKLGGDKGTTPDKSDAKKDAAVGAATGRPRVAFRLSYAYFNSKGNLTFEYNMRKAVTRNYAAGGFFRVLLGDISGTGDRYVKSIYSDDPFFKDLGVTVQPPVVNWKSNKVQRVTVNCKYDYPDTRTVPAQNSFLFPVELRKKDDRKDDRFTPHLNKALSLKYEYWPQVTFESDKAWKGRTNTYNDLPRKVTTDRNLALDIADYLRFNELKIASDKIDWTVVESIEVTVVYKETNPAWQATGTWTLRSAADSFVWRLRTDAAQPFTYSAQVKAVLKDADQPVERTFDDLSASAFVVSKGMLAYEQLVKRLFLDLKLTEEEFDDQLSAVTVTMSYQDEELFSRDYVSLDELNENKPVIRKVLSEPSTEGISYSMRFSMQNGDEVCKKGITVAPRVVVKLKDVLAKPDPC